MASELFVYGEKIFLVIYTFHLKALRFCKEAKYKIFSDASGFKFSGCPMPHKQEVSSGTGISVHDEKRIFL